MSEKNAFESSNTPSSIDDGGEYHQLREIPCDDTITVVYIAYCHDRHIDPEVGAFYDRDRAIAWARSYMREAVSSPDGLVETDDGNTFTIQYSFEEDHAFVKKAEIGLCTGHIKKEPEGSGSKGTWGEATLF